MTTNRLSYSAINLYSGCGERYRLHYEKKIRDKWTRSSLIFGGAVDKSLNVLLETRDLAKALAEFDKQWAFSYINKQYVAIKNNPDLVYSDKDLDPDYLNLSKEDEDFIKEFRTYKKAAKWGDLSLEQRGKYNGYCWDSLGYIAKILIRDYSLKILPQFIEVSGIQYESEMTNSDGDTVKQYLDFVAQMQDGSVILFDNKTTSQLSYYPDDAPGMSQQLISYYYTNKEKFGLTGVGYVAMQKALIKNKEKICHACGASGSDSKAKTCDKEFPGVVVKRGKEVEGMVRCNGEWKVTINPECAIKVIINPVSQAAIDLVLSTFDDANYGIKNKIYQKNLSMCNNVYGSPCIYKSLCWSGKESEDTIKLEDEKKD